MSDRVKGLTVIFSSDLHEQDAQRVADAIALFGGVASVKLHVCDGREVFDQERVRLELERKLFDVVRRAR